MSWKRTPHSFEKGAIARAKPKESPVQRALQFTAHLPAKTQGPKGGRFFCSACCTSVKTHPVAGVLAWLGGPCAGVQTRGDAGPANLVVPKGEDGAVVMGGRSIHSTHHPTWHAELKLWFCTACGRIARHQVRSLGKPCPGLLDRKGRDNLQRVQNGLMPGDSTEARSFNKGRLQQWGGSRR